MAETSMAKQQSLAEQSIANTPAKQSQFVPSDEPKKRRKRIKRASQDLHCKSTTQSSKLSVARREHHHIASPGPDKQRQPSQGAWDRVKEKPEQASERLDRMCCAVRTLLECVGEDADREGLLSTPMRYAKALLFLTKGYRENMDEITNNAFFHEDHNEMVIVKNIEINSLCEHHLVPFTGKMHIGYIPSKTVIGLSKLPRIADMFARRLQVQERLTKEVANAIQDVLKPQGVAVIMESRHMCMVMRGVEKPGTVTITNCFVGCFEKNFEIRNEFLNLVSSGKSFS